MLTTYNDRTKKVNKRIVTIEEFYIFHKKCLDVELSDLAKKNTDYYQPKNLY